MLLLVGLGNPGPGTANSRHNVGFLAVDAIAERHSFTRFRRKFHGLVAEGRIGDARAVALKPLTYMNHSGRAVAAAARFYRVAPERIVVLHDDVDLQPGKVRAKQGGGTAGHKGLESIGAHLGKGFARIRIGVGRPPRGGDVTAYVLRNFAKADAAWLEKTLAAIAEALPLYVGEDGDASRFMTKVALLSPRPKPRAAGKRGPGGKSGGGSGEPAKGNGETGETAKGKRPGTADGV